MQTHDKGGERGEITPWRLHQWFGVGIKTICYREV